MAPALDLGADVAQQGQRDHAFNAASVQYRRGTAHPQFGGRLKLAAQLCQALDHLIRVHATGEAQGNDVALEGTGRQRYVP